ncbi:unnamed protein product, partial [Musa acuminata subsp. burmannicoides]
YTCISLVFWEFLMAQIGICAFLRQNHTNVFLVQCASTRSIIVPSSAAKFYIISVSKLRFVAIAELFVSSPVVSSV